MIPIKTKNEGSALIVALFVLIMIIIIALTITLVSIQNQLAAVGESQSSQSFQMADSGIEDLMYQLTKAGHEYVDEVDPSDCQTSGIYNGLFKTSSYILRLQDKDGNAINCDDSTVPTADVASIKSVSNLHGQARAIEADVICRQPYETDPNTVALYHFQEDGDSFLDYSGHDNVAGVNGTLDTISGICKARYFDGNSSNYIYVHDPDVSPTHTLRLDSSMTISAWVKLDSAAITNWERIVGKGGDVNRNYDLGVSSSGWEFQFNNGAGVACSASTNTNFDTSWHFITGVYDGSNVEIYVDGNKEDSNSCSITPSTDDSDFLIGNSPDIAGSSPFSGVIDEVRVSNTDMSGSDISDQYDKGAIFNLP